MKKFLNKILRSFRPRTTRKNFCRKSSRNKKENESRKIQNPEKFPEGSMKISTKKNLIQFSKASPRTLKKSLKKGLNKPLEIPAGTSIETHERLSEESFENL